MSGADLRPPAAPPSSEPSRRRLRLVTANLWSAIDHTWPWIGPPVESPWAHVRRLRAMEAGLRSLRLDAAPGVDALTVFGLQEVNPIRRLSRRLARAVEADGVEAHAVNTGLRVGDLSWPLFLQEGVVLLWRGDLRTRSVRRLGLSGSGWEGRLPVLGLPIGVHTGIRRGAIVVSGEWRGLRLCVVDTHLHHTPPVEGERRRRAELEALLAAIAPEIAAADATFLLGDLNCEREHPELRWLEAQGFEELSRGPAGAPLVTWDPSRNPLCRANAYVGDDPIERAWDAGARQLDHVFCKRSASFHPAWTVRAETVFGDARFGAWISDHLGVVVDVTWSGGTT